jgi:hypothetical protein
MFGAAADPSLVARIARDMSAAPLDVALARWKRPGLSVLRFRPC